MFGLQRLDLDLPQAEIRYFPNFLDKETADHYYKVLLEQTPWQQDQIKVFGKTYDQPRLTALYGNNGKSYSYSSIIMEPHPYTDSLMELLQKLTHITDHQFTTCLLNLYRVGSDSNGWHADNEKELGINPVIASVSLGQERMFHLKHRTEKSLKRSLLLEHGSLLLMQGETQHHWLHQIPKTKKPIAPRINLTFRRIV
ncbi:alpha-ketoglutarate-dependent dioxygenase AlkB [Flavobacterium sp. ASW18X]|uniref:alpha-ketoglutarate-dependent dioxygenase AlkB family protein n=1 Tax=Flavobacterium sp. ASW18X TaxID=2572595 RepID=UPI0010AE7CFC|nr:alpha-ketoglutarate-dependent dioxygenase AlkB [Flavobacterium sp. ASW18X]TKD55686.1 alpha-ketoglutarate-dependent dioxygenase AlkB [Flavobacterium sp. ASW18X]